MHDGLGSQRQRPPDDDDVAVHFAVNLGGAEDDDDLVLDPLVAFDSHVSADAHDLALPPDAPRHGAARLIGHAADRGWRRDGSGGRQLPLLRVVQVGGAEDEIGIGPEPFAQLAAGQLLPIDRHGAVAELDDGDAGVGLPRNQADAVLQGHDVVAFAQPVAQLGCLARQLGVERGIERHRQKNH